VAHGAVALTGRRAARSPGAAGPGASRALLALLAALGLTALAPAAAQPAAEAYARAEAAFVAALTSDLGRAPTPDDAAWRAAIEAADAAVAAAREAAAGEAFGPAHDALREALALSARVYGLTGWHSRAFAAWDAYLTEGGEVLARAAPPAALPAALAAGFRTDLELALGALGQLAFARYQAGDLEGAQGAYLTMLELDGAHPEALRWLARIAFESGDTAVAIRIWERLLQVAPDDEGARFFLELSREREAYGAAASDAYRAGLRAYEAGDLAAALPAFERAYAANAAFVQAAVWAGRTALELGRPAAAARYWRAVLDADPGDARAAWFLEVAQAQQRWGVEAANAYYAGQSAYAAGDLEAARASFEAAAEREPSFVDALVWAARTSQEAGDAEAAVGYWEAVLRLDPADQRARWFLQAARQQREFGERAGAAFAAGLEAYQAGDAAGARAGFTEAVRLAPGFAAAWGYLGQLEFLAGDHAAAAEAYARALELEPDNDDYAFFAQEARRLAGVAAASDEGSAAGPDAEGPAPDAAQDAEPDPERDAEQNGEQDPGRSREQDPEAQDPGWIPTEPE